MARASIPSASCTTSSGVAGTLTIPALAPAGTIGVTVRCDSVVEPDETFFVDLSNPVNATLVDGRGQVLLVDY